MLWKVSFFYLHWEIGKRRVVAEGTTWKKRPGQTSVDKKMSLTNPCFIKSSPKAKEWRGKGIGSQQKHEGKSLSRCTTVTMEDFPTGVILQTPPPDFSCFAFSIHSVTLLHLTCFVSYATQDPIYRLFEMETPIKRTRFPNNFIVHEASIYADSDPFVSFRAV